MLNKFYKHKFEIIAFAIFWVLAVTLIVNYKMFWDDLTWLEQLKTKTSWEYFLYSTKNWQPRYPISAMQILFVQNLGLWKIVNSICLTLSLFIIYKIAIKDDSNQHRRYILLCLLGAFWLIYVGVLYPSYIWLAGSPVYNIAFCALIFSLLPFINLVRGKKNLLIRHLSFPYFASTLIACYCEQTSVILSGFSICMVVFSLCSSIKIQKRYYFYTIWIILNSAYFNIINLNAPRIAGEQHWIPSWEMLSLMDKIYQAVTYTNYYIINVSGWLFLANTVLMAYVIYRKYSSWLKYLGFFPLVYSLMGVVPFENVLSINSLPGYTYAISNIFAYGIYDASKVSDFNVGYSQLMPAMGSVFTIVLFGLLLFFVYENIREKFIVVTLYLGGLIVSYAIGFTSAFFAIGGRAFFVVNMIMLIIFASQCRVAIGFADEKMAKRVLLLFLVFCSMFAIRTIIIALNNYIFFS